MIIMMMMMMMMMIDSKLTIFKKPYLHFSVNPKCDVYYVYYN